VKGNRFLGLLPLAVLGLIILGAIALSLASAPPIADTFLRTAARNTQEASSFRLDMETRTELGQQYVVIVHSLYRAPDRAVGVVRYGRESIVLISIGARSWESSDGGHTWQKIFLHPRSVKPGSIAFSSSWSNLVVSQDLADASGVKQIGDRYHLTNSRTLNLAFRESDTFTITLNGEFLHVVRERIRIGTLGSRTTASNAPVGVSLGSNIISVYSDVDQVTRSIEPPT